jgi:hypothetical protein
LFVLSAGLLKAQAQTAAPNAPEGPAYLLRLERTRGGKDVCVLLQQNGQYHLEHHTVKKTRVFEGDLNLDELRSISQAVSGDQLSNLKQTQIPESMLDSGGDLTLLAFFRKGDWQQLSFNNSSARAPFRESLDPLLRWLDNLQERKVPELSDGHAPSDCQPSKNLPSLGRSSSPDAQSVPPVPTSKAITVGSGSGAGASSGSTAIPRQSKYIFRMQETKGHSRKLLATCVILSASGAYHLVKESGRGGTSGQSSVLDGTLDRAALVSLRQILDAPDVKAERSMRDQLGENANQFALVFKDGADSFLMFLSIPREGGTQQIASWRTVRLSLSNFPPLGLPLEHGEKLLQPFREWLKANIDDKRAVPSVNPLNGRCSSPE